MKPGRPLAFGKVGNASFIGLPGNPVSSFVTFLIFVRPFLLRRRAFGNRAEGHRGARGLRLARAGHAARVPARKMERARADWICTRRRIRRCSPPPPGPTAWSTTRRSTAIAERRHGALPAVYGAVRDEGDCSFFRQRARAASATDSEAIELAGRRHDRRRRARASRARGGAWAETLAETRAPRRGKPGHGAGRDAGEGRRRGGVLSAGDRRLRMLSRAAAGLRRLLGEVDALSATRHVGAHRRFRRWCAI